MSSGLAERLVGEGVNFWPGLFRAVLGWTVHGHAAADMGKADFLEPTGNAGPAVGIHAQEGVGTRRGEEADQVFGGTGASRDNRSDHLASSERTDRGIGLDGAVAADDCELAALGQRIDQGFAVGAIGVAVQRLDLWQIAGTCLLYTSDAADE